MVVAWSACGRTRRELVRRQAAAWFAEGIEPPEVARRLRISPNSAYAWIERDALGVRSRFSAQEIEDGRFYLTAYAYA